MRNHLGERPFECFVCNKTLYQIGSLSHTREKNNILRNINKLKQYSACNNTFS